MDASQQEENYDMAGTKPTLPTAEPDNPQAYVDPQTEGTGTKLQHNPIYQETAALVDMTYKATNMNRKEDKRGQKAVFYYSDNEQVREHRRWREHGRREQTIWTLITAPRS
jgi:hypothetical protein